MEGLSAMELDELDEQLRSIDLKLLRKSVPGMKDLSQDAAGKAALRFRKQTFPAGHCFLEQGEKGQKAIYVISRGSVVRYCRDVSKFSKLPVPGVRTQDVFGRGSIFGSLGATLLEPFSIRCSKPCEVFCIMGDELKKLPESLLVSIRKHLARDAAWNSEQTEALPSTPSSSPKKTRRSAHRLPSTPSSYIGRASPSSLDLPNIVTSRTHCIAPNRTPSHNWLEELDRVIGGGPPINVLHAPEEHCTSFPVESSVRPQNWCSRSSSEPSLARAGASILSVPVKNPRKCAVIVPFFERSGEDLRCSLSRKLSYER